MSGPVPLLMVLYSNDAVEIRYSDGASLQLSSCGSTMIHHVLSSHRNHSKSSGTHKRSRFVTSEHRQKVLQALDFRNRFAERPYLCEELLEKHQIVGLYANIESLSWAGNPGSAKVEILEDGSRKVNSLDEYASLVVSPHGQDFTVCYLSKISLDKEKVKQELTHRTKRGPTRSPPTFPQTKTHSVNDKNVRNVSASVSVKSNEAVVYPLHCAESLNKLPGRSGRNAAVSAIPQPNLPEQKSSPPEDQSTRPETHQQCETDGQFTSLFSGCRIDNTHPCSSCHHGCLKSGQKNQSPTFDTVSSAQAGIPLESHNEECQLKKHAGSFPNSSINSHDISSISRSSTPDGLRTMIDSDATLGAQDISATTYQQGSTREVYKQRHSSPTNFTSSPYEAAYVAQPRYIKGYQFQHEGVLGGSYIAGDEGPEAAGVEQVSGNESELDNTLCEDSCVLIEQLRTVVGQESDQDEADINVLPSSHSPCRLETSQINNAMQNQASVETTGHTRATQQDKVVYGTHLPTEQKSTTPSTDPRQDTQNQSGLAAQQLQLSGNLVERSSARDAESNSEKSSCRNLYVWTTSHGSRNDCHPAWVQPLKLALAKRTQEDGSSQLGEPTQQPDAIAASLNERKSKGRQSCRLPVPAPLPVTCPFQHLHRWDAEKTLDVTDALGTLEFQHGMLKVVISEGIVYRFVKVANIHVVEVHPGDGSIIVSQGVKGHFFTHYIIVGDQIEERTYSLKSLPPGPQKGPYSISKLIQTANRYLMMNQQWERRGLKQDLPCWKREVVAVVEPLSSSLLEECVVEGVGRFSAFTNGRVRAVFDDRTALDMVCNFSRRVSQCLNHSQEAQTSLPAASEVTLPVSSYEAIFGASTARLLLPSGQYVTVDVWNPGQYKDYIHAGKEWASWVSASPAERHQFYTQQHMPAVMQRAAEHELKKIFCFNYILEQTLLMQQEGESGSLSKSSDSSPRSSSSAFPVSPQHTSSSAYGWRGTGLPATATAVSSASLMPRPPHQSSSGPSSLASCSVPHQSALSAANLATQYSPTVGAHQQPPPTNTSALSRQASAHRRVPIPSTTDLQVFQSRENSSASPLCHHTDAVRTKDSQWEDYERYGKSQPLGVGVSRTVAEQLANSDLRAGYIVEGFDAVRQVLLRNSSLINDIDQFLDISRNQDL